MLFVVFIIIDQSLKTSENTIKSRDQEIMKIIHDLKNPTIAIENMVNKIELNSKLKENIN